MNSEFQPTEVGKTVWLDLLLLLLKWEWWWWWWRWCWCWQEYISRREIDRYSVVAGRDVRTGSLMHGELTASHSSSGTDRVRSLAEPSRAARRWPVHRTPSTGLDAIDFSISVLQNRLRRTSCVRGAFLWSLAFRHSPHACMHSRLLDSGKCNSPTCVSTSVIPSCLQSILHVTINCYTLIPILRRAVNWSLLNIISWKRTKN